MASTFFLIWNCIGLLSFFGHLYMSTMATTELSEEERALYAEFSAWTYGIFGIAVISGLLGSLGLLLQKNWSYMAFLVSICAIVPQMVLNVFFTRSIEVYGLIKTITMPFFVIVIGLFLLWFSKRSVYRNWYR